MNMFGRSVRNLVMKPARINKTYINNSMKFSTYDPANVRNLAIIAHVDHGR